MEMVVAKKPEPKTKDSNKARRAQELDALYKRDGELEPERVLEWAEKHPSSALHASFQWDDTEAAKQYRLWQARQLITEVVVVYEDRPSVQKYVSIVSERGERG